MSSDVKLTVATVETKEVPDKSTSDSVAAQASLGQIYTPEDMAERMADMLTFIESSSPSVLDPGAGFGALTEAVVRSLSMVANTARIDSVEVDSTHVTSLRARSVEWSAMGVEVRVYGQDFLDFAEGRASEDANLYSHIIMNPPYARIPRGSEAQQSVRRHGYKVSNMYAAFLWAASDLLAEDGQLVAIVPRSFCNGNMFRALREHIFGRLAIVEILVFEHRNVLFARDKVLQEVIVINLRRTTEAPASVHVEWAREQGGVERTEVPYKSILDDSDGWVVTVPEPDAQDVDRSDWPHLIAGSVQVSTGPVVDFRTSALSVVRGPGMVPLIDGRFQRLHNRDGEGAERFLPGDSRFCMPPGNYVVVARFSPNERRPRIRATLITEDETKKWGGVAFENHVNVFHFAGGPLTKETAQRILEVLADPDVDRQFRERSGSTQVNISDLKALRVPPRFSQLEVSSSD